MSILNVVAHVVYDVAIYFIDDDVVAIEDVDVVVAIFSSADACRCI